MIFMFTYYVFTLSYLIIYVLGTDSSQSFYLTSSIHIVWLLVFSPVVNYIRPPVCLFQNLMFLIYNSSINILT